MLIHLEHANSRVNSACSVVWSLYRPQWCHQSSSRNNCFLFPLLYQYQNSLAVCSGPTLHAYLSHVKLTGDLKLPVFSLLYLFYHFEMCLWVSLRHCSWSYFCINYHLLCHFVGSSILLRKGVLLYSCLKASDKLPNICFKIVLH